MLEVLCDNSSDTHWVKNQSSDHPALPKAFMNNKAKALLNWIINHWMSATYKTNIIWDRVLLIYAILDDIHVDIGEIQHLQMLETRTNMKWTLYFVHTLSHASSLQVEQEK